MSLLNFHPDVIARVAPKVMPKFVANDPGKVHPHDPGAYERVCNRLGKRFREDQERAWLASPWTYDKVADYMCTLDFVGQSQLEGQFDRFMREEQAEADRRRTDLVCRAEDELRSAEKQLREERQTRARADADVSLQESVIAELERTRPQEFHTTGRWLAATRKLEEARIELERRHLLVSKAQPNVDSVESWVTNARAKLEKMKQEQAQNESATQVAE